MEDDVEAGCWEFPTDVLAEILVRLPPSSRRRFRLVCRHWRDAVDDRTTEMRSRAKVLFWNAYSSVAYVVDDLSPSSTGSCTELWRRPDDGYSRSYSDLYPVGTCNGLLCLCDNRKMPGGAITLVNPATGEALAVPPLPCAGLFDGKLEEKQWVYKQWHQTYTFGYHPVSGKYKVVHVPSMYDEFVFDTVQVLTLGETSWREVPAGPEGGAWCRRIAGIVSVDGTTYWTTNTEGSAARVMSFDLEHERVSSIPLPPRPERPDYYPIREVHGRLGILVEQGGLSRTTKLWVLEKGRRWSHRYSFSRRHLPRPHFVHDEYVLTLDEESISAQCTRKGPSLSSDVVLVSDQDHRTPVAKVKLVCAYYPSLTLAYVETTEPLSAYATN